MKTEPTEEMREKVEQLFNFTDVDKAQIDMFQKIKYEIAITAFKKGQSNPKIKQLELDSYGLDYVVKTPVGHYMIRQDIDKLLEDDSTCTLSYNGSSMAEFNSIDEAKAAAQADYERRVMECIDKQ